MARTTVIRIGVEGGTLVLNAALAKVRAAVKATDEVRIEDRRIIVELTDRYAADAAPLIARRLRDHLAEYHPDVEIDD